MTAQSPGKACAWIFRSFLALWAQAQSLTEKARAVYQQKVFAARAQLHRKFFMRLCEKFCFVVVGLLFCPAFIVNAQIGIVDKDAKTKPTIMILGTYHMGTPGNNVVNGKVDDVTTPDDKSRWLSLSKS